MVKESLGFLSQVGKCAIVNRSCRNMDTGVPLESVQMYDLTSAVTESDAITSL